MSARYMRIRIDCKGKGIEKGQGLWEGVQPAGLPQECLRDHQEVVSMPLLWNLRVSLVFYGRWYCFGEAPAPNIDNLTGFPRTFATSTRSLNTRNHLDTSRSAIQRVRKQATAPSSATGSVSSPCLHLSVSPFFCTYAME